LNLRAIKRVVEQYNFRELWESSTKDDREWLIGAIEECDIEGVRAWMRERSLEDKTKQELVDLARYHGIPNYSRMLKYELVEALTSNGKTSTR
jgi:hypothetical protein